MQIKPAAQQIGFNSRVINDGALNRVRINQSKPAHAIGPLLTLSPVPVNFLNL